MRHDRGRPPRADGLTVRLSECDHGGIAFFDPGLLKHHEN